MIYLNILVYLVASVIIIWNLTAAMIEKKRIGLFLPFYVVGILFCFNSAFLIYKLPPKFYFAISKFILSFVLFWIFINIRREHGN